ncbi:flagellar hook-basal body complex protein FliE [Marinivivus vitaminiproducens]|uniref:flagellar hook-basal body complex protein FliE n=1 Tax=Marinivivus vitaminiproducens TaxID=3035935 RepID=UPI0027985648|nr:flagellar hook-basal body complex protein FliE [Geminicoccaceae bacterium SCSIO 64248]
MDIPVSRALAGYAKAPSAAPASAGGDKEQGGFAGFMADAARTGIETLQASEAMSVQAALGTADAQSVVEAVAAAELTLQTVTAVRDRVVEAYQDLIRMPI